MLYDGIHQLVYFSTQMFIIGKHVVTSQATPPCTTPTHGNGTPDVPLDDSVSATNTSNSTGLSLICESY